LVTYLRRCPWLVSPHPGLAKFALPKAAAASLKKGLELFCLAAQLNLGSGFLYAYYPAFWAIPTMMLSEAAAAATFGLINSIGQLGGFAGNYAIGFLNDRTHSLAASFAFISVVYVAAGGLILSLRVRDPIGVSQRPI
jgi:nitrate/nitrite transporter NarK